MQSETGDVRVGCGRFLGNGEPDAPPAPEHYFPSRGVFARADRNRTACVMGRHRRQRDRKQLGFRLVGITALPVRAEPQRDR